MQEDLEYLLKFCRTELPGAPEMLILNALNEATVKLCRESGCWNTWESVVLQDGVSDYSFTPPEFHSRAFLVRKALFNGREFKPTPEDQLAMINPSMFSQQGTPTTYWMSGVNHISVLPKPTQSDVGREIKMRVSWTPTSKSITFDSELMERYIDAITLGAKARLMKQPMKEWSNPQMAVAYEQQSIVEIGKARIDQMHDMTIGSIKTSPRAFGRW